MIETFTGRNTGIANKPTTVAAYLNGIFASANPAEKEIINCKIRIPKVKNKVLPKIRGVITCKAST